MLGLAPYGAEADVTGDGADAFVEGLRRRRRVDRHFAVGLLRAREGRRDA